VSSVSSRFTIGSIFRSILSASGDSILSGHWGGGQIFLSLFFSRSSFLTFRTVRSFVGRLLLPVSFFLPVVTSGDNNLTGLRGGILFLSIVPILLLLFPPFLLIDFFPPTEISGDDSLTGLCGGTLSLLLCLLLLSSTPLL